MASRLTASACLSFLELYRQVPHSERHAFTDVLFQIACMCGVAGTACSPSIRFVNVQIVQVQIPVSKIGKSGCFFIEHHIFRVTIEAEFIFVHTKRRIELRWIIFSQKTEVRASMGDVAPAAIVVGDGPMLELHTFDLVGKGRKNFIFAYFLGFAMAGHAKSCRLAF